MKLFMTLLLFSNLAIASTKTFTHKTNKVVANSLENIVDIVMDVESYCKSCKYKMKEVVVTEAIEYPSETRVYVWTHSASIAGTYKFFSFTGFKYLDENTVVITTSYPSNKVIQRLKRDYGLEHKQPFSEMRATWTVKRLENGKSRVYFDGLYKTNNPFASLFKKKVQEGIEKGAADFLNKFMLR